MAAGKRRERISRCTTRASVSGRLLPCEWIRTREFTLRPCTPSGLAFFCGDLTNFIKTQTGVYDDTIVPPMNQMVIQLEGSNTPAATLPGQGGMFDIIDDGLKWAGEQTVPPGMVLWTDSFRIGAYDIPIPSEPTILTNSRLHYHLLTNTMVYDPSVETLTTNWSNVEEWSGGFPGVHSSYDANGLDVWFESTDIGVWLDGTATESQGVRMVTFFNGEFPVSGGGGDGGEAVPEPATLLLYGLGFAGAGVYRRLRKKR